MPILDLGCGAAKRSDAIGVDQFPIPKVNLVCNLNRVLPFRDSTIDGIYASHVVEHVDSFLQLMEEIWRISKPGAWVRIWTPHFSSGLYAWGDPTHRRAFATTTFDYLADRSIHYINCRFHVKTIKLNLFADGSILPALKIRHRVYLRLGEWIQEAVNRTRNAQLHFERLGCPFFPFSEVYAELEVQKPK